MKLPHRPLLVGLLLAAGALSFAEIAPPGVASEGEYPFAEVIRTTTGHEVVPFDRDNEAHRALLGKLTAAARRAGERARVEGIRRARANEAGLEIERHVRTALGEAGLTVETPVTRSGVARAVGYPDLAILADGAPCYLELKTHNARTVASSQRTFYYSPSADPKVTTNALHLLLAFELERSVEAGQTVFRPGGFRLVSLHAMPVRLKIEYNQSNRGMYGGGADVLTSESIGATEE